MIPIVLMKQRICDQCIEGKENKDLSVKIALVFLKEQKQI